mmetsp:Transcript_71825/g.83496  ORF Transcript_71825/g.83496 Transcript_71825/m.83496 type:complete len:201 (+) Transcript_71825:21-623(+)
MTGHPKKVLVPVAEGAEEIETACIVDILRRSEAEVLLASIMKSEKSEHPNTTNGLAIKGSRGLVFLADTYFEMIEKQEFDMIVLPGGARNAELLGSYDPLIKKLRRQKEQEKWYAAICASPALVFQKNGLIDTIEATCHPSVASHLKHKKLIEERVVVDQKCITSRGPGTAIDFSLTLVEHLFNKTKAMNIAKALVHYFP